MGRPVRSKKMAISQPPGRTCVNWTYPAENGPHRAMADRILRLDRRAVMGGLGSEVLGPAMASVAGAQGRPSLTLQAKAGVIALHPGGPDTPIWSLQRPTPDPGFHFKRGDELEITLQNQLPVPTVLNWHGIDGVPTAEPLAARMPLGPGAEETLVVPLRHAGTFLCDQRLLGDGQPRPSGAWALVVQESDAITVDRDEVLLIEDWRLRAHGTPIPPAIHPTTPPPLSTLNS